MFTMEVVIFIFVHCNDKITLIINSNIIFERSVQKLI